MAVLWKTKLTSNLIVWLVPMPAGESFYLFKHLVHHHLGENRRNNVGGVELLHTPGTDETHIWWPYASESNHFSW